MVAKKNVDAESLSKNEKYGCCEVWTDMLMHLIYLHLKPENVWY